MKYLALWLIKAYQVTLSPMLPPSCRYYPTCSRYAYTAIDRYGLLKGGLMAGWRVLRCNPWTVGGYDPVDDRDRAAHEAALAAYDAHETAHTHPR